MTFGLQVTIGESVVGLQSVFDDILLKLPALALTLIIAWLMRKKNVKAPFIIICLVIIGLLFGAFGILV